MDHQSHGRGGEGRWGARDESRGRRGEPKHASRQRRVREAQQQRLYRGREEEKEASRIFFFLRGWLRSGGWGGGVARAF